MPSSSDTCKQRFVPPRPASKLARPRYEPKDDSIGALALAMSPGTHDLPTSFCTSTVNAKAVYWVAKARQNDPFVQKVAAARNLQLERLPFRDAILYQYGLLPDQYVPPREDPRLNLHPCDKVDARLPQSLVQLEASKARTKRRTAFNRKVFAWDSTMKNVTAPILWRAREPLF